MHKDEFDYYIFMDYSENLIGYIIIPKERIKELLPKIKKFKHYKGLRNKINYLNAIKKVFEREQILNILLKHKITELRYNIEICSEIFDFCKRNINSKFFISVDDRQFKGFMKIASIIDGRFKIIKEGKLKKDSKEYKFSLIIDTYLNLKRTGKN